MSKRSEAWRHDIVFVDTTVKSGVKMFAPTWAMVLGLKGGEYSEEEYTVMYKQLMRESFQKDRVKWLTFLKEKDRLAIACYCAKGEFCHRYLLKDIFQAICEKEGIPFEYYGELE
jgi:uncharacterized protein YeaO (DUF488 family)